MTSVPIRIVLVEPSHPGNIGAVGARHEEHGAARAVAGETEAVSGSGGDRPRLRAPTTCSPRRASSTPWRKRWPAAATWPPPPLATGTRTSGCWMCAPPRNVSYWRHGAAPAAVLFGAERTGLLERASRGVAHALISHPRQSGILVTEYRDGGSARRVRAVSGDAKSRWCPTRVRPACHAG